MWKGTYFLYLNITLKCFWVFNWSGRLAPVVLECQGVTKIRNCAILNSTISELILLTDTLHCRVAENIWWQTCEIEWIAHLCKNHQLYLGNMLIYGWQNSEIEKNWFPEKSWRLTSLLKMAQRVDSLTLNSRIVYTLSSSRQIQSQFSNKNIQIPCDIFEIENQDQ